MKSFVFNGLLIGLVLLLAACQSAPHGIDTLTPAFQQIEQRLDAADLDGAREQLVALEPRAGQDERLLLPAIDKELQALPAQSDPQVVKLQTRWSYLRTALADMNSQSNTLQSVSGRPFAPITVDRHARAMTAQWMAMF